VLSANLFQSRNLGSDGDLVSVDLDLGDVEVVLSSQLDSEGSGRNVGDVVGRDGLVLVSVLLPCGIVEVVGQLGVMESLVGEHDVEVAQSILALIGSVGDDDSLDDGGSIEVDLEPFLGSILGVVE